MGEQLVVAGPASQGLAVEVADYLQVPLISSEVKVFPDGECYLRLEVKEDAELADKDVIIIQTTGASATANQSQHLYELIMMISAAKRAGAAKIRVVMPYFAYSRQDKAFRPGECLFANEICKWIETAGATEFYTIDMHAPMVLKAFTIPTFNLDPMALLADTLKDKKLTDPVVICPDKGAYDRSRAFAKFLGDDIPVVQFDKKRDVKTGEVTMEGDIDVKGKDVIIADDIISTGGTMSLAINIAKKGGAKGIYALGTHPLLIKNAVFKLKTAGTTQIIGTNTMDSPAMDVSMADLIGKALKL